MFILRGERGIRSDWDGRDSGRATLMEYERSVWIPVSLPLNDAEESCFAG